MTARAVPLHPNSQTDDLLREILAEERAQTAEARAQTAELRALRADLRGTRPEAPASIDAFVEMLPAISAALGDKVFSLVDLAALGTLPNNEALGRALAPVLGRDGGLRSLGRSFARCVGRDCDGYELLKVGTCRDGSLWQVVRVT